MRRTPFPWLVVLLAAAALGGCGFASSAHPLSDAETTVLDETLIGRWHVMNDDDERHADVVYVGKRGDAPGELEAVWLELTDGQVGVNRVRLLATKIGEHRYLSFRLEELSAAEAADAPGWYVARYVLTPPDALELRFLGEEFAANAIRAGTLSGKAEVVEGTEEDPVYERVLIEAPTKELRAWLAKNATKAFAEADILEEPEFAPAQVVRLRRAQAPDEEKGAEGDE